MESISERSASAAFNLWPLADATLQNGNRPMPALLRRDDYGCYTHDSWDQFDYGNADLQVEFYRPIMFGQPLTDRILSLVPNPYRIGGRAGKEVPDIFGDSLGPWHVSERVKDIIEELEPGLHTFISLNVIKVDKDGKQEPILPDNQKYFLLHTTRVVKAVVFEETEFEGSYPLEITKNNQSASIALPGKCTLSSAALRDCHFWRGGEGQYGGGGQPLWHHYFASDQLVARLKTIGAKGWRFQECTVKSAS
jgi:hypothetical protein